MQRLNSLVLIAFGVGLLTYTFGQPASYDVRQLEDVTRIAFASNRSEPDRTQHHAAAGRVVGDGAESLHATPISRWSTVVRATPSEPAKEPPIVRAPIDSRVKVIAAPVDVAAAAAPATPPGDVSRHLVKGIQRALQGKRCYAGSVSGRWDHQTRDAMVAFLSAANATLPVDEPNAILLTVLNSHRDTWCGVVREAPVVIAANDATKKPTDTARIETGALAPGAQAWRTTTHTQIALPERRPATPSSIKRPPGMMGVGATKAANATPPKAAAERPTQVRVPSTTHRSVALMVEPIDPDSDETDSGGKSARALAVAARAPVDDRWNLDDDGRAESASSRASDRPSSPAAQARAQDVGETRRPRAKRPRLAKKRRKPSYAEYKPRRRTWLRQGSVRYQIRQAIAGPY